MLSGDLQRGLLSRVCFTGLAAEIVQRCGRPAVQVWLAVALARLMRVRVGFGSGAETRRPATIFLIPVSTISRAVSIERAGLWTRFIQFSGNAAPKSNQRRPPAGWQHRRRLL
jgi:hypothetical protein